MNVNFADETRRNCKKKLGSQCLCNESNREKIYRVLRINATHAMSVKKKKKNMFRSKGNVCRDSKNLHTQQCWATEKIEKPVFRPFAFRKQNLPLSFSLFFFFSAFLRSICCALNAFSNGTPARNYQHCYILVSRYAVCQFHGSYSATGPQHRYRKRSLCKNKGQGTNRPFNSLPVWWRSAESPGKNLTSCLRK